METALEIEIRFQEVAKDDPKLQPAYNKFIQVIKECDAMLQLADNESTYIIAAAHLTTGVLSAQEVLK
jgi:hypothetical protein